MLTRHSALRRWVLYQGWRKARYVKEPKLGDSLSLLLRFADELEQLA